MEQAERLAGLVAEDEGLLGLLVALRINLRWHDLRHEYASRRVEHGVPLAQVRDLLDQASITATERYDNQTVANLKIAAAKLERGHAFAPGIATASAKATAVRRAASDEREASLTRRKFQDSFKISASDAGSGTPRAEPAIEANKLDDLDCGDWLEEESGFVAASAKRRRREARHPRSSQLAVDGGLTTAA